MKGIPQGRYTKEFRQEAVKLVTGGVVLGRGRLEYGFTDIDIGELGKGI